MYTVKIKPSALEELKRVPGRVRDRIKTAVESLKITPRPPGVRKIAGRENLYRFRVGDYRVIYEIDDEVKTVRIYGVRKRDEAYR